MQANKFAEHPKHDPALQAELDKITLSYTSKEPKRSNDIFTQGGKALAFLLMVVAILFCLYIVVSLVRGIVG